MEVGTFILACLPYFIANFIVDNNYGEIPLQGRIICKIVPITALFANTFSQAMQTRTPASLVRAGLLFSLIGDICLEQVTNDYFLPGLASFLIAHILYIVGFESADVPRNSLSKNSVALAIGVYGYFMCLYYNAFTALSLAFLLVWFLAPGVPKDFLLPIVFYALVIGTMTHRGFQLYSVEPNIFYGAVVFMISDSMIAVDKFYYAFPHAKVLIMITYYAGQFGITAGAKKKQKQT